MLVSVEATKDGVTEYHRQGSTVWSEPVEYQPWLLVPGIRCTGSEKGHFLYRKPHIKLEGGYYDRLIEYDTWRDFRLARSLAYENGHPILAYGSPVKNYLMRTGKRMFEGGGFDDVHRLVLDIETTGLDPATSELLMVALLDNRGNEDVICGPEPFILKSLVNKLRVLDPDVIEGHNLVAFDLPFILARMGAHSVAPCLGRDKREAVIGRERKMMIGPNERWFAPVYIPGRHVIDTLIQVQKYDLAIMRHESYGLKAVARDFGIEESNRIELDRSALTATYASDPELVELYALQDVRETKRLAEIVCPVEFMQCLEVPDSYQGLCATGNGEKWNSILIAEYLSRGRGIPERQQPSSYVGGLVELHKTGVIRRVVKADVESLYPSLMLSRNIKPASDTENVLLPKLQTLKDGRIHAKRMMEKTEGAEHDWWDGYNQSAKMLINSAYGFMGGPFHFGDWRAAEAVTLGGRDVVGKVRDEAVRQGAVVIEVDTDGIFFGLPAEFPEDEASEKALVETLGAVLPEGIYLAHDGRYEAMLSLAMKNYALLGYDGKTKFKGASLKSRSAEKINKEFLRVSIGLAFRDDLDGITALYNRLLCDVYHSRVGIEDLQRRERITENTHSSPAKARLSQATAHLGVGEFAFVYERADGSIGLATDWADDANVLYYMRKARAYFARLSGLWDDWDDAFPNPGKRNIHALVGEPDPPKLPVHWATRQHSAEPAQFQTSWSFDA